MGLPYVVREDTRAQKGARTGRAFGDFTLRTGMAFRERVTRATRQDGDLVGRGRFGMRDNYKRRGVEGAF